MPRDARGTPCATWSHRSSLGSREEDGHSFVTQEQVPAGLKEVARKAALGCPGSAIEVDEASDAREETR